MGGQNRKLPSNEKYMKLILHFYKEGSGPSTLELRNKFQKKKKKKKKQKKETNQNPLHYYTFVLIT